MDSKETLALADALAIAVNKVKAEKSESSKMTDMIFKAFSTISLGLIMWTLNTIQYVKEEVQDVKKDQEYSIQEMKYFKSFTEKPRFTAEDFQQRIIPLTNQLNMNTAELNSRVDYMSKTDSRLQELELEVRILKAPTKVTTRR